MAKLARACLVASMIGLTILGILGPIIPALIQLPGTAPIGAAGLDKNAPRLASTQREPPGVPLPDGTIGYGSAARPSISTPVDSTIPPHLGKTKSAYVYDTSFGTYSFDRSAPFVFSVGSRSGHVLSTAGFFFVNSTVLLTPGRSAILTANDTAFQVKYSVDTTRVKVGDLLLTVNFQSSVSPKFSISFSRTPSFLLTDFNIIWLTLTTGRWLRSGSSTTTNIERTSVQTFSGNVKIDTGSQADPSQWREWLTIDWSVAGRGISKAGFFALGGYSGYGNLVVFDKNVSVIDPTVAATSTTILATAYSTQRKSFDYGGYYFLFYYDGSNIVYVSSMDGINWSAPFVAVNGPVNSYGFDLYQSGMWLALAWLNYNPSLGGDGTNQLLFRKGTILGGSVSWSSVASVTATPWTSPYSWPPSVAITSDGTFWAGGIWQDQYSNYNIWIYKSVDGATFTLSNNYPTSWSSSTYSASRYEALQLLPLPKGQLMALSSHYYDQSIRWTVYNPLAPPSTPSWSTIQSLNVYMLASTVKHNAMSATTTPDGTVKLIYVYNQFAGGGYTLGWASYDPVSTQWSTLTNYVTAGAYQEIYPALLSDTLGNLYAFWSYSWGPSMGQVWYSFKPPGDANGLYNWQTPQTPFGAVSNAAWISGSRAVNKQVSVVWTQSGSPIRILYGSIPLPSGIASSPPNRPWSRQGMSPYEQYFVQNGEYVSPGNGLLTVSQTDISVPGRNGLSFSITRLYSQPWAFLQGSPFNYETSPYANLGRGWQLNLPWVDPLNNKGPIYLHFLNGETFPIVWNSVTQDSNGIFSFTMENHQTEDFVLTATSVATPITNFTPKLTMKDGTVYNFNRTASGPCWFAYCVSSIVDRTGQNQLTFSYSNYILATVTDTIGRIVTFSYNGGHLASVTYGGQTISYGYLGENLVTITDSASRTLSLSYWSQNNWFLSGVTYSTGGSSAYSYGSVPISTDALNYYIVRQDVYVPGYVVKSSSFSYNVTDGEVRNTSVKQSDGQSIQGYTNYLFNPASASMTRSVLAANSIQMLKQVYSYDAISGRSLQQDVYSGTSTTRLFYNSKFYDMWGNVIYSRDNSGHESYQSFANTNTQWTFQGPGSLASTASGKLFFDDFLGPSPNLDSTIWTSGGSASSLVSVANGLLNMTASSGIGLWKSSWVRTNAQYSFPFYAEAQMALLQNPSISSEAAELIISPQATPPTGDAFNNNDAIRIVLYDQPHYQVIKNVGGVQTVLKDWTGGNSSSLTWRVSLTDRNTLIVYSWGTGGFQNVFSTSTLGLSSSFAPAYVYLLYRTSNNVYYTATFDYACLTTFNSVTINNLQSSQRVKLFDSNNNLVRDRIVGAGQTSLTIDTSAMLTPYGYFQIYELDGRTVQFTSTNREIYGGDVYSYNAPFKSGGLTRTSTGYVQSSAVYFDDVYPAGAVRYAGGGDDWVWVTSSYGPVASGGLSHTGLVASGTHEHYFNGSTYTISLSPGTLLLQYVYIPSVSVPSEIMLQFHTVGGNWEHRAYWGANSISACGTTGSTCGINGGPSRLPMGTLPLARDSWAELVVKADDLGLASSSIDGWAYTLYDGGIYWDYSATANSLSGSTMTINNLYSGQTVEIYDSTGTLKQARTSSGTTAAFELYSVGVRVFPFNGYLKIYDTNTKFQYSSPILTDLWGGDTFAYNRPVFSNKFSSSFVGSTMHNLPLGSAQYQNTMSTPEESYANFDNVGNQLRISQTHNGVPLNTTFTFDLFGNRLSSTNPTGQKTYYAYSPTYQQAYLTNVTRILASNVNVTSSYAYDRTSGMRTRIIDPLRNSTDLQYDSVNRLKVIIEPAVGGFRSYAYSNYTDSQNNFYTTNQNYNSIRYKYDNLGRNNATILYNGGIQSTPLATYSATYNWGDLPKTTTMPDGNTTRYRYDYLGRLVNSTNADLTFKTISYDDVNLIESTLDENNHRVDRLYDTLHRLIGVREYYSPTAYYLTSYTYDGLGNLVKIVDAKGQTTTYSYDDMNRLIYTLYPDNKSEIRIYDNVGNLQSKTDPNGSMINYAYDSMNRLTTITYPDGKTATYAYDKNNNLISTSLAGNSATFNYDAKNRLISETWTISGNRYSLTYSYDNAGNVIGILYPDGRNISFTIDPLNHIQNVQDVLSGAYLARFSYLGNRVASISYEGSTCFASAGQTAYNYDVRNRVSRITTTSCGSTLLDLTYAYDNASNIIGINTESYGYDFLNRLTSSTGPWGSIRYGYDSVGNRSWMMQGVSNTTYTYGPYNRMTIAGATTYTYDNNGNEIIQNTGSANTYYYYDYENRMNQTGTFGPTATYVYGPLGQRIQKTEGAVTTIYLNRGVKVLYEKQTAGGSASNDYVYANGRLIAKLSSGYNNYFVTDILGSVRLVTTTQGVVFSSNYAPFGQQNGATGTDPTYKYTAKPQDSNGLYYYGARYYDLSIGRFTSRDPSFGKSHRPQTLNPYVYVTNNPCTNIDPTGRIGRAYWDEPGPLQAPARDPVAMYEMHSNPSVRPDPIDWLAMHGQPGPWSAKESQALIDQGQAIIDSIGRAGTIKGQGPLNSQLEWVIKAADAFVHWSDFLSPCQQVTLGAAIDIGWTIVLYRNPMMIVGIQAVGVAIPYLIGTFTVVEGLDPYRQTQQWDCLRPIQPWTKINPNF